MKYPSIYEGGAYLEGLASVFALPQMRGSERLISLFDIIGNGLASHHCNTSKSSLNPIIFLPILHTRYEHNGTRKLPMSTQSRTVRACMLVVARPS